MDSFDYRNRLLRLMSLLDEDAYEIDGALRGELLEKYRKIIETEKERVYQEIKATYN